MHLPIHIDGVVYSSINQVIKSFNLDVREANLYKYLFRHKRDITLKELNDTIKWIKENVKTKDKKEYVNLGDVFYDLTCNKDNFKDLELFLMGIPVNGTDNNYFIDYFQRQYKSIKDFIPTDITLNYIMDILHYHLKGEVHPSLSSYLNGKSKVVKINNKPLSDYAKMYGLSYNMVWKVFTETKPQVNSKEAFIKGLEEKRQRKVQTQTKK